MSSGKGLGQASAFPPAQLPLPEQDRSGWLVYCLLWEGGPPGLQTCVASVSSSMWSNSSVSTDCQGSWRHKGRTLMGLGDMRKEPGLTSLTETSGEKVRDLALLKAGTDCPRFVLLSVCVCLCI